MKTGAQCDIKMLGNVKCVKYYQFFNRTMIHQGSFTTQG